MWHYGSLDILSTLKRCNSHLQKNNVAKIVQLTKYLSNHSKWLKITWHSQTLHNTKVTTQFLTPICCTARNIPDVYTAECFLLMFAVPNPRKCYIWLWPYHRGLRFGTYLGWNFRFGLRSRGQNVSKLMFFLHKCSNRIRKELFKWSEIWHDHRPIYGTDSWLRKCGGPWHKKGVIGVWKVVFDRRHRFFSCIFEHQGVHLDKNCS